MRWDPFAKWGYGDCKRYSYAFEQVTYKVGKTQVIGRWFEIIAAHPLAYIEHRAVFAFTLLRHMSPIEYGQPVNRIGVVIVERQEASTSARDQTENATNSHDELLKCQNAVAERSGGVLESCSKLNMFLPWDGGIKSRPFDIVEQLVFNRSLIILSPFICMFLLAWKFRDRTPADLLASVSAAVGVGNFLMLVFFGVASDGRYMLPTMVSAIVCLLAVLKARYASKISSTRRETSASSFSSLESKAAL